MANNPVQIVLNAQDFVLRSEVNPGGSNKDFFEGRDAAFIQHKNKLINEVSSIDQLLKAGQPDGVLYAKVELQANAWAKSHRPIQKVFPQNVNTSLGGDALGTMFVELAAPDIQRVITVVDSAESTVVRQEDKQGKLIPKPSRVRSEVGAIRSIRPYGTSDRRRFSLEQAASWLADPRTGGAYYIETFVSPQSIKLRSTDALRIRGERALAGFERRLDNLSLPVEVSRISQKWTSASIYVVRLSEATLKDEQEARAVHSALLGFLDHESIVKSILLPPVLQTADVNGVKGKAPDIPLPDGETYPVIGIIDTGVAKFPALSAWSVGASDYVDIEGQDVSHGTFIAGLICAGDVMNSHALFQEGKCKYFDLGLHPTSAAQYKNFYPRGFIDFLEQLDAEIPAAKKQGARVFNMSLAVSTPVTDDCYSIFANILDEIADSHDILFVLPSGNLDTSQARPDWPSDANQAMRMLAGYRYAGQDRIFQPADSIRALVVGALDPQHPNGTYQPARYTRRGPGPSLGTKPDLAHIGGKLDHNSGLFSVAADGAGIEDCGTSYASPLASKTVAAVNYSIEGSIGRDTLIALVVHHARLPKGLDSPVLKPVVKDFVGAGIPAKAAETLLTGDSEITLVFNGTIQNGQELRFQFAWPASLVNPSGGCSGSVRLTLAYRPPVDRNFGAEFVRVNLDTYLRQESVDTKTGEVSFRGRLKREGSKRLERELVQHGAKWWPIKTYEGNLKSVGQSSQWRLIVDPLARSGFVLPDKGVPFCAVLTIQDSEGKQPIFNEMRAQLQTLGITISDIRTALRARI